MAPTTYSIHGDILDTDSARLAEILDSPAWRIRAGNGDELQLRNDSLDMAIYANRPGDVQGWNYLVSAVMDGERDQVRATLEQIAGLLTAHGIVYNFEFVQEGSAEPEEIVRHPDF